MQGRAQDVERARSRTSPHHTPLQSPLPPSSTPPPAYPIPPHLLALYLHHDRASGGSPGGLDRMATALSLQVSQYGKRKGAQ